MGTLDMTFLCPLFLPKEKLSQLQSVPRGSGYNCSIKIGRVKIDIVCGQTSNSDKSFQFKIPKLIQLNIVNSLSNAHLK